MKKTKSESEIGILFKLLVDGEAIFIEKKAMVFDEEFMRGTHFEFIDHLTTKGGTIMKMTGVIKVGKVEDIDEKG